MKEEILSARLEPGALILELQLAKEFGVSRTPVREALRRLVLDGLVTVLPRRGYIVRSVSLDDVVEILTLRRIIEPALAAEAALHHQPEHIAMLRSIVAKERQTPNTSLEEIGWSLGVHKAIAEAVGNRRAIAIVCSLLDETARFPWLSSRFNEPSSADEHARIVDSIEAGDAPAARELMRSHLEAIEAVTWLLTANMGSV